MIRAKAFWGNCVFVSAVTKTSFVC